MSHTVKDEVKTKSILEIFDKKVSLQEAFDKFLVIEPYLREPVVFQDTLDDLQLSGEVECDGENYQLSSIGRKHLNYIQNQY